MRSFTVAIGRVLHNPLRSPRGHKRLYASSLAFKTILALVPALALIMVVLASDAFSEKRGQILDQIVDAIYPVQTSANNTILDPSEPKNLQELNQVGKQEIRFSVKKFAIHSRRVGFFGFVGFILVVFLLLRDVEGSFNFLWGVSKARPLLAQVVRHTLFFLGLTVLAVILLVVKGWANYWNFLNPVIHHWIFAKILHFAALWVACSWMYLWLPHAKVDRRAAFISGLMTSFLLEAARWGINMYTVKFLQNSHIYGALWMFPVILVWFYLCWVIILIGAETTFFLQTGRSDAARL